MRIGTGMLEIKKYNFMYAYKKLPIQMKASLWFVLSTVLLKGISFITVPIFTRLMDADQYGIYNVYLTWCEIFTVVGTFGFESCAYMCVLTKFNIKDRDEAESSLLELAFFLTTSLLLVFWFAGNQISKWIGLPKNIIMLMCVQIYFIPAVNFWSVKNRFQYKYKSLVFVSISMAVANAVLGILFLKNFFVRNQAIGRIFSIIIVQAVYGIALLNILLKEKKISISIKYWKWALKLHLPLLPHTLSLKILAGADKIMINTLIGATATALYSVSYSVAVVVNLIKTSIIDAIRPWIYTCLRDNKTDNVKNVMNGLLVFVSALTLVFVAFAPEVIKIVAPINYYEAIYCMPPVMISSFFTFLYSTFSIIEMYYEETKKVMVASISAAILNVILNAFLIPRYGYIAAAFTTLICYIFLAVFHFFMAEKVLRQHNISIGLFDGKMITGISLFLLISLGTFEYLYTKIIMRYIFIIVILLIIFVKRKYFINLLKIIRKK